MKARFLKPGQKLRWMDSFNPEGREVTFVKRLCGGHDVSGRSINIFQCDDLRGLNGPTDNGIVEFTDHGVSRKMEVA